MGPIFEGEVRLCELDFSNDPAVAAGASLASAPTITVLQKRGEEAVSGAVLNTGTTPARAAPAISGNTIRFWLLGPTPGRYIVVGTATLSNNELAEARDDLLIE